MVSDVARPSDDRAFDQRAPADVGGCVDDRADRARALAQRDAVGEDGVGADRCVSRDPAVVADERGPLDLLDVVDVGALADPDVAAQLHSLDVQAYLLVERVEVRLPVLVEVADVLPVAVHDVAVDRPTHLEQQREELLREVVRPLGRDVLQHLGLEHVDAGVDRVREDLPPGRLLEEALDLPILVGDDDAELEWVVDRLQADRDGGAGLVVPVDERAEIDVAERVAGDDEERLVEQAAGEADGAGGAERQLLDRVLDVQVERLAVAEVASDRLRHERERDHDVVEAVTTQQLEDVLDARLADDRDHRLGLVRGERAQARPLATRHHDRLHAATSRRALTTYCAAASKRKPEREPEQPEWPFGRVSGDGEDPDREVEQPGGDLAQHRDVELVPARHEQPVPGDEQRITQDDDRGARPWELALERKQNRGGVDHQPVRKRVGDPSELGFHVPAPREEAVDLVCHPCDEEDPARGPARAVVGADVDDDEDRDQREPQQRERVRQVRERCGDCAGGGHPLQG